MLFLLRYAYFNEVFSIDSVTVQKGCFDKTSNAAIHCKLNSDATVAINCCQSDMCNLNLEPLLKGTCVFPE